MFPKKIKRDEKKIEITKVKSNILELMKLKFSISYLFDILLVLEL